MNIFLLDYDADDLKQLLRASKDQFMESRIESIKKLSTTSLTASDRVVFLTHLSGGWMEYHRELVIEHPQIQHWVFCVTGQLGTVSRNTLRKRYSAEIAQLDSFTELIFENSAELGHLKVCLSKPPKSQKKCMVLSCNISLAKNVASVMKDYLSTWTVTYCETPDAPDYTYCDVVILAGNVIGDMCVPCPSEESVKKYFWFNTPVFKEKMWRTNCISELKKTLNAKQWNIYDYAATTYFSGLYNEQILQQLEKEIIQPMALVTDTEFVAWDDYALPIPSSKWTDESIHAFLEKNTTFRVLTEQITSKKKRN